MIDFDLDFERPILVFFCMEKVLVSQISSIALFPDNIYTEPIITRDPWNNLGINAYIDSIETGCFIDKYDKNLLTIHCKEWSNKLLKKIHNVGLSTAFSQKDALAFCDSSALVGTKNVGKEIILKFNIRNCEMLYR